MQFKIFLLLPSILIFSPLTKGQGEVTDTDLRIKGYVTNSHSNNANSIFSTYSMLFPTKSSNYNISRINPTIYNKTGNKI